MVVFESDAEKLRSVPVVYIEGRQTKPLMQSALDYEQLNTILQLRLRVDGGHYLL